MIRFNEKARRARSAYAILCATLALWSGACAAASRPPDPGRPRTNEAPYPIILAASEDRREQALAAWNRFAREQGIQNAPPPELQPVTATLRELPPLPGDAVRLPKINIEGGRISEEEETREALRRFIRDAGDLLGVEPQYISLVTVADQANGVKQARYQQSPFIYPLRGGYGVLEISFTTDRRVLRLTSTAIPDTERLRRALTNVRQLVTAEQAATRLANRSVTYRDAAGAEQSYLIPPTTEASVRELVVYPLRPAGEPVALALHLAWEVAVDRQGTPLLVYVDAVTGEIIATAMGAASQVSQKERPPG